MAVTFGRADTLGEGWTLKVLAPRRRKRSGKTRVVVVAVARILRNRTDGIYRLYE